MLLIHLIIIKAEEQCTTYKMAKYLLALPSLVVYRLAAHSTLEDIFHPAR